MGADTGISRLMPETLYYLAYGSNLHPHRLSERVASCRPIEMVVLDNYSLRFHKRSKDNSGKCNAFYTGHSEDRIHGVIYEFNSTEKKVLDNIEGIGKGYEVKFLSIPVFGIEQEVFIYTAIEDYIDETLKPYSWYKELVLQGAIFHGFPRFHIDALTKIEAMPDPNDERRAKHVALLVRMQNA